MIAYINKMIDVVYGKVLQYRGQNKLLKTIFVLQGMLSLLLFSCCSSYQVRCEADRNQYTEQKLTLPCEILEHQTSFSFGKPMLVLILVSTMLAVYHQDILQHQRHLQYLQKVMDYCTYFAMWVMFSKSIFFILYSTITLNYNTLFDVLLLPIKGVTLLILFLLGCPFTVFLYSPLAECQHELNTQRYCQVIPNYFSFVYILLFSVSYTALRHVKHLTLESDLKLECKQTKHAQNQTCEVSRNMRETDDTLEQLSDFKSTHDITHVAGDILKNGIHETLVTSQNNLSLTHDADLIPAVQNNVKQFHHHTSNDDIVYRLLESKETQTAVCCDQTNSIQHHLSANAILSRLLESKETQTAVCCDQTNSTQDHLSANAMLACPERGSVSTILIKPIKTERCIAVCENTYGITEISTQTDMIEQVHHYSQTKAPKQINTSNNFSQTCSKASEPTKTVCVTDHGTFTSMQKTFTTSQKGCKGVNQSNVCIREIVVEEDLSFFDLPLLNESPGILEVTLPPCKKSNKPFISDKETQIGKHLRSREQDHHLPVPMNSLNKAVHSVTLISEKVAILTEPIRFKASKSQHGIWYVSLRGDVFLNISQDILKQVRIEKGCIEVKDDINVGEDILRTMKLFVDNYKKLSDCFDDDQESDDESFINGFRL